MTLLKPLRKVSRRRLPEVLSTNKQHRDQLLHAFESAEKVVVVLSGWATSYVVDSEFQRLLAKALKRGVSVYLGYGYQAANEPTPPKKHEKEAEDNLETERVGGEPKY